MVGVGGAYVASAEDIEGAAVNSAAPAVRDPYSTSWFELGLGAGISFPSAFSNSDFDNHGDNASLPPGHASAGSFTDLGLGLQLQLGALGFSATGDLQQYQISSSTAQSLTLQIGRWKALGAYGLFHGQLVVGAGARIVTMQILQSAGSNLLTMTGVGPEVGALYMPTGQRFRLGATARAPVSGGIFGSDNVTTTSAGVRQVGGLVLPGSVTQPWEIEAGVALQLGPRPLNPGWIDPHEQEAPLRAEIEADRAERARVYQDELARAAPADRARLSAEQMDAEKALRGLEDHHLQDESERLKSIRKARYRNWPREKILMLASVLMTGPSDAAVSVEGFLDQRAEAVGTTVAFTPRLGLEGEPIPGQLVLRTGSYLEPSRYEGSHPRQHFTFGADIHLFPLTFWGLLPDADWKLALVVDLAPRYQNLGFGIANWY